MGDPTQFPLTPRPESPPLSSVQEKGGAQQPQNEELTPNTQNTYLKKHPGHARALSIAEYAPSHDTLRRRSSPSSSSSASRRKSSLITPPDSPGTPASRNEVSRSAPRSQASSPFCPRGQIPPPPNRFISDSSITSKVIDVASQIDDLIKEEVIEAIGDLLSNPEINSSSKHHITISHDSNDKNIRTITININGEDLEFRIKTHNTISKVALSAILSRWHSKHPDYQADREAKYQYNENDIRTAIEKFKVDFEYNWHIMKEVMNSKESLSDEDNKTVQIINDLRTAFIEEIYHKLKEEFPDKKGENDSPLSELKDGYSPFTVPTFEMQVFGSNNLLSDKDPAFKSNYYEHPRDKYTMEAKLVSRFNSIFESYWKILPSARVFDINAYTMQYLNQARNFDSEYQRADQQAHASFLMMRFTMGNDEWASFKNAVLAESPPDKMEAVQAQFDNIEAEKAGLDRLLDQQIISLAFKDHKNDTLKILKALVKDPKIPIDTINENNLNDFLSELPNDDVIRSIANFLLILDNSLKIRASNAVHESFKTSYSKQETLCAEITLLADKLVSLADKLYDFDKINPDITNIMAELESKCKEAGVQFDSFPQDKAGISKFIILFTARRKLEEEASVIQSEILYLESEIMHLQKQVKNPKNSLDARTFNTYSQQKINLTTKRDELKAKLQNPVDQFTNFFNKRLENVENEISLVQKELVHVDQVLAYLSVSESESSLKKLSHKRSELITKLKELQTSLQTYSEGEKEIWDLAGIPERARDNLIIEMNTLNSRGMLFAQEAHVSEGGFLVVVRIMQAKEVFPISIDQGMQAFREIYAFFRAHQEKPTSPEHKALEVSKYADRLNFAYELMVQKANNLKIPPPPEISEDLMNHFKLFTDLLPLRGQMDKTKLEAEFSKHEKYSNFSMEDLNIVNSDLNIFAAKLEAWYGGLDDMKHQVLNNV